MGIPIRAQAGHDAPLLRFSLALAAALPEFAARGAALLLGLKFSDNPGVAFGLLGEHPALACLLSAAALAVLLCCLWRLPPGFTPGLAVMAGGAAANLIDRLFQGAVRDWIPLPSSELFFEGGLRFNLADVEIVLGAALVLRRFLSAEPVPGPQL